MSPDGDSYELFLRLFSEHRDRLFAYIHSMLPHRYDAEDVFQRCSIVMWRKFDTYERDRDFMAWACGVAFFEVRNFIRVASRDHMQFSETLIHQLAEHRSARLSETSARLDALQQCLESLDPKDRELVRCAYDDSRSLNDIAKTSGRAIQTLYNRLSILRRRLFECVSHRVSGEGAT